MQKAPLHVGASLGAPRGWAPRAEGGSGDGRRPGVGWTWAKGRVFPGCGCRKRCCMLRAPWASAWGHSPLYPQEPLEAAGLEGKVHSVLPSTGLCNQTRKSSCGPATSKPASVLPEMRDAARNQTQVKACYTWSDSHLHLLHRDCISQKGCQRTWILNKVTPDKECSVAWWSAKWQNIHLNIITIISNN